MKITELFEGAGMGGLGLQGQEASVTPVSDLPTPIRVWLGTDSEQRYVAYFELAEKSMTEFRVSRAISVQPVTVQESDTQHTIRSAKVMCHDSSLNSVFATFIENVLQSLTADSDVADTITAAAQDWRELVQIAQARLSDSAAAGLFGELKFLTGLVQEVGPEALEAWQRNPHDVHDFIAESARVEVKTSVFQNRSAITVHGLRQLEPPHNSKLTLAVAEVQKHGGQSLDDVISELLELGVDRQTLHSKLADAGYVYGMPSAASMTFAVLSWRFWTINASTPVLNKSAIPIPVADGIGSLSYELNLSVLGDGKEDFDFKLLAEGG